MSIKIYTKQGDEGKTGLWGGQRVSKDSLRVSAYGDVDELNAVLGLARAHDLDDDLDKQVRRVQSELFVLGSDLATPDDDDRIPRVQESFTQQLETEIDQFEQSLEPLQQFILPGGTVSAAHIHLARTVCRRAERSIVTLADQSNEPVNAAILPYVNRLSDWLFVLGRVCNSRAFVNDVPWVNPVQ